MKLLGFAGFCIAITAVVCGILAFLFLYRPLDAALAENAQVKADVTAALAAPDSVVAFHDGVANQDVGKLSETLPFDTNGVPASIAAQQILDGYTQTGATITSWACYGTHRLPDGSAYTFVVDVFDMKGKPVTVPYIFVLDPQGKIIDIQ